MATEWSLHAFFNPRNSLNAAELIAREQNATKGPNKDVYQAYGLLFTAHLASAATVRIKGISSTYVRPDNFGPACCQMDTKIHFVIIHWFILLKVKESFKKLSMLSFLLALLGSELQFAGTTGEFPSVCLNPKGKQNLLTFGNEATRRRYGLTIGLLPRMMCGTICMRFPPSPSMHQWKTNSILTDKSKTLGDVTADSCMSID